MTAATALGARQIVPVHYGGWAHFRQPRAQVEEIFAAAGLTARTRWLAPGERAAFD